MNRYVAFMDVVGFGALVEAESLATVKAKILEALKSLESSKQAAPLVGLDGVGVKPVHEFSFSDTFVLLSDDCSEAAALSFFSAVTSLTRSLYAQGLPVRGAVTFGEADFLVGCAGHAVGKGIITAANLEKQQEWLGVFLDEATFPESGKNLIGRSEFTPVLSRWDVPVKGGKALENALVINWRYNLQLRADVRELFRPPSDDLAKSKLANTLKFEEWLRDRGLHEGETAAKNKEGHKIYTPWLDPIVAK